MRPLLQVVLRATPDQTPDHPGRERVASQSAAARLALADAARLAGCPLETFPQDDSGVPLPRDGWHWSISHDATYVASVVHRAPVGVDLQRVEERRAALTERVANEAERALLAPFDALAFARLWTAKEAVLKAAGVGLTELSQCRLVAVGPGEELWLAHRDPRQRVVTTRIADHVASVHAPGTDWDVLWHRP